VSLFAGIGGIDLGLERAGHECVGQVEIDPYCQAVLARHWPDTPRIADVRDFHGTEFGPFDLLTGGYPCQPFSHAGDQVGDKHEAHLWPEVRRIIRNVRPRLVLLENVIGHLSIGFGDVLADLASSGYDAEWDCIPASAVGAPHRRDRLWVVAHAHSDSEPTSALDDEARWLPAPTRTRWPDWTPDPATLGMDDGLPRRLDGPRLEALGNAVVPQVAELIGRRLS
jgi:DNA (cytosine-5)-methyltransferase 1